MLLDEALLNEEKREKEKSWLGVDIIEKKTSGDALLIVSIREKAGDGSLFAPRELAFSFLHSLKLPFTLSIYYLKLISSLNGTGS